MIFRSEHFVGEVVECIAGFGCSLARTKNQTDRRIFAFLHPVLAGVIEIEVHLSGIRISEAIRLEVDDDQTAQTPVEEKKIDPKPSIVEAKSLLASEKSEVVTQLQQEVREMADERLFEITFRVLVL